ncbi:MAG: glycosyltransferase family 39 protein [Planctomycetes bacterium]|nr:glycosyltransferase family 39 protein [Planctomycetota bacterium]
MAALRYLIAIVLLAALATVATCYAARTVNLQWRDNCEGPLLAVAARMRHESPTHAWFEGPEYTIASYGPLYYRAVAWAGSFAERPSLTPGRVISLVAMLLTAALLGAWVYRRTRLPELGLVTVLFVLVGVPVAEWIPFARVDATALLFTAAATIVAAKKADTRAMVASAVLVVIASLARQTAACSALPVAVYWWCQGESRWASKYLALVGLLGALAWGGLHFGSHGYWLDAAINSQLAAMRVSEGLKLGTRLVISPLGVAAVAVLIHARLNGVRLSQSLPAVALVTSFLYQVVMGCKLGSSVNYLLEPSCWVAVVVVEHGFAPLASINRFRTLIGIGVLAAAAAVHPAREMMALPNDRREAPIEYEHVRTAIQQLGVSDGELLVEDRLVDLALAASVEPRVNDPFAYYLRAANGTLDAEPLAEDIHRGKIKLLILSRPAPANWVWPEPVSSAMKSRFMLWKTTTNLLMYCAEE